MKKTKQVSDLGDLYDDSISYFQEDIKPKVKTSEYLKTSISWVNGCVNAIADVVAMINVRLYKDTADGPVEVFNHPAIDVLYKVNGFMTKFDMMWLTSQYLDLAGEAPWFVSYKGTRPDQLILLRPDQLSIIKGDGGEIVNGYTYKVGNKDIPLAVNEVVYLRYPDPNNPFRGRGVVEAIARSIDIDQYSEIYNEKFFSNSARPDSVLSTDGKLTMDQLRDLEKKLSKKFKGLDNAQKTIILQNGLKFTPMNMSSKDMDFIEQQRFGRDKIMAMFRVPKSILGITEDVNRANAEAGDFIFAKRTIKPKMERIIEQLNEFYLPLFAGTENMYLDFDDPVPENVVDKMAEIDNGLRNGWLTLNEARAMRGLDGIGDEGDKNRIPSSLTTAGESLLGRPDPVKSFSIPRRHQINARKRFAPVTEEDIKKAMEQQVEKQLMSKVSGITKKKDNNVPEIEQEEIPMLKFQEKQLAVGDSFVPEYRVKVLKTFREQRKKILAMFDGQKKVAKKAKDKFQLSANEEADEFLKLVKRLMGAIVVEQSVEAYKFIGMEGAVLATSEVAEKFIRDRAFKTSFSMTEETNRLLADALADGFKNGEGIPQLKKRVNSVFKDMASYRSERIARTETLKASNWASQQAYEDSGVVRAKRWLTAIDDRTCGWCGPMNGTIIDLKDEFFKKGDDFTGRDGKVMTMSYESIEQPPLHVNCRCTTIPIVQRDVTPTGQKEQSELQEKVDKLINEELDA